MPGITAMELPIDRPSGAVNVRFIGTVLVSRWGTLSLLSHHHSRRPDLQFMPLQLDPRDSLINMLRCFRRYTIYQTFLGSTNSQNPHAPSLKTCTRKAIRLVLIV